VSGSGVAIAPVDAAALEKAEQAEIVKLFRAFGFTVYVTSQYRPAKVSAGIPDLIAMHQRRGVFLFWETKRSSSGRFSAEQQTFDRLCDACGIPYGAGDHLAAVEYLIARGIAVRIGESLEPA